MVCCLMSRILISCKEMDMQKRPQIFFIINRVWFSLFFLLAVSTTQAAAPSWIITPAPGSSPTQTVPENVTATVQYMVQNQPRRLNKLVMKTSPGIQQTTSCELAPKGQIGSSCTLG